MSLKDFEVGKVLGKGAFGMVCIVTRKTDGMKYAMKKVNIGRLSQDERAAALNEVRLLASIKHPNIIQYHEAFYDEPSKTLNIIMELADDGDIEGKIQDNKKKRMQFAETTIWSILLQILQGIKYLHEHRIIHRDLKSANIFLMKNGLVKIGDLNVSKVAKLGMARTQTGTPYYAAPEIWDDSPYDSKVDIWSIGCIIYEMCTSNPPFRGTSLPNLAQNIKKGKYERIKNYSNDLSAVISFMLITRSSQRYSAEKLLNDRILVNKYNEIHKQKPVIDISKNEQANFDLIKTIKLPKAMKDLNNALPKRKYKKNQEDMMMNDEYETKKANVFKMAAESNKSNNDNKNNQHILNNNSHNNHSEKQVPIKNISSNNNSKNSIPQRPQSSANNNKNIIINKNSGNSNRPQNNQKIMINHHANNNQARNPAALRPASGAGRRPNIVGQKSPRNVYSNNNEYNLVRGNNNPAKLRPASGRQQVINHHMLGGQAKKSPPKNIISNNRQPAKKKVIIEKYNYKKPAVKASGGNNACRPKIMKGK